MTLNNIPQGYKATALGIIPQEWEVVRFGKVMKCFSGGTPKSSNPDFFGGKIPFIKSGEIHLSTTEQNLSEEGLNQSAAKMVNKGDLLYALYGANSGDCAISKIEGAINQAILCIRTDAFDIPYLLAVLELNRPYYTDVYLQGGQGNLSAEIVKSYMITVPPLAEQRKIAEVLGVWDEAIEKQVRLIEKLDLRKRALMQRLLSAKLRLPGFSEPWEKVKLGEIGKFDKGYGVPKESIRNTGNKAITYGEIYTKHDFVIKKFTSYIDDETAVVSKKITQGAILFTGSGETLEDIGKCVAFIDNDIAYAGGDIIIFNPSIEINSLVLSYCLNSAPVNAQKVTYGQGHSVVHIYQKDLAKLQVTIPSFSEQTTIAEVLTAADREIELAKEKLERLRRQKRGLMQQLLSGKKRIKY